MAYRSAPYRLLCGECRRSGALPCQRCRAPRCAGHRFTDDDLCQDCEAEWLHRSTIVYRPHPLRTPLTVATMIAGYVAAGVVHVSLVAVFGVSMLLELLHGTRKHEQRQHRRAFIDERLADRRRYKLTA